MLLGVLPDSNKNRTNASPQQMPRLRRQLSGEWNAAE